MTFRSFAVAAVFAAALTLNAQTAASLIAEADRYTTVTFENHKALEKLLAAEKSEPNNYEVLWRISRSYVDIGEHLPGNTDSEKEKQLEYYQKALDYANKAIAANPNAPTGYVRRAIANGRVALFKGVWSAIDFVKQTKADCEKAIQLDPNDNVAYYVLGRTHAKLCEKSKWIRVPLGLGWANMEESFTYYEKAIALRPNFIMFRLDAAKAYIAEEEYAKAKEHLIAVAAMPKQDEDDDKNREEAKELLQSISGK